MARTATARVSPPRGAALIQYDRERLWSRNGTRCSLIAHQVDYCYGLCPWRQMRAGSGVWSISFQDAHKSDGPYDGGTVSVVWMGECGPAPSHDRERTRKAVHAAGSWGRARAVQHVLVLLVMSCCLMPCTPYPGWLITRMGRVRQVERIRPEMHALAGVVGHADGLRK